MIIQVMKQAVSSWEGGRSCSDHAVMAWTYERVIFLFTQEYTDGGEAHRDGI
jgi:hypothetical protein